MKKFAIAFIALVALIGARYLTTTAKPEGQNAAPHRDVQQLNTTPSPTATTIAENAEPPQDLQQDEGSSNVVQPVSPLKPLPVILMTGFEPFGRSRPPNPSWEGVKQFDGEEWKGFRIVSRQLPVVWGAPLEHLTQWIDEFQPVAVFSFGQGGGYSLETLAENTRGGGRDNLGEKPIRDQIVVGGASEFSSTLDAEKIAEAIAQRGFRVRISREAGNYLCEECLYSLEHLRNARELDATVMFCHIPPLSNEFSPSNAKEFMRAVLESWYAIYREPPSAEVRVQPASSQEIFLSQLGEIIGESVTRRDTHHPVFHGSIDWHSAVHGHWALFRLSRVTGRKDLVNGVLETFESNALEDEAVYLKENPEFEMPYGRAWFLRLAMDYKIWCQTASDANASRLQPMADEVAESLLNYYQSRSPSPASREYSNDSWALSQMASYFASEKNEAGRQAVNELIKEHFLISGQNAQFQLDRDRPDFFSCFGNWAYLIAQTQTSETLDQFLRMHPIAPEELAPVDPLLPGAHHLGINWSRAWAFRALSEKVTDTSLRQQFHSAYERHVEIGRRHHQKYAGDFYSYDHWVPQFAVYALTHD
jgi:pyrrolidone-carboxylate peptidase